ncbi:MAG TPA: hypothetical protein VIY48_07180 [Candidatus Paceibacterota bacterium]
MADVRSSSGVPTIEAFASASGTPIVVDRTAGIAYIADSTDTVVEIGFKSVIASILTATASLSFGSIAANGVGTQTITVTGAATGDTVVAGAPAALEAGLTFSAFVSATNTVTIRLHNNSGGSVTPATATWRATVIHFA